MPFSDEQFKQLMAVFGPKPQQGQGNPVVDMLQALRPQHLGMGGAPITEANPMGNAGGDPFTNGFFKTTEQRRQVEHDRLGGPGSLGPMISPGVGMSVPGAAGVNVPLTAPINGMPSTFDMSSLLTKKKKPVAGAPGYPVV